VVRSIAINGLQGDNGAIFLSPKLDNQRQWLALGNGNRDGKPKTMGNGI
jgi:hypothetical protein